MVYTSITTEIEDQICIITINRPDKLNALNKDVFSDLDKAMDEVIGNPSIKSAIITGAGPKAFVAGADITEFAGLSKEAAMALAKRGQDVFFKIENSPKPVVDAKFGQPEVNLGLIPGYGGTQRLTQLVGKGKSMELQMTAQLADATEALQMGLVNHVTTPESLLERTKNILQIIHSKAPFAIGKIIDCINTAAVNDGSSNGYDKEIAAFGDCFVTEDMKEGTTAFLEKRKAVFIGK
jgi:enoyl-CoA hydratase